MLSNKRSYAGKLKELISSSRQKLDGKDGHFNNHFSIIRQATNAIQLPMYASVLGKTADDGVNMEHLDQLQQDLEKLLSTTAVRIRQLHEDMLENCESNREKNMEKNNCKRKRPDDRSKSKDKITSSRFVKKQYLPVKSYNAGDTRHKIPKVTVPKNDNSNKFWASIETYCSNVSGDDVSFLDTLIKEFTKEIDLNIPEIGDHYSQDLVEGCLNDEENQSRSPKVKALLNDEVKKNGVSSMVDSLSTPSTQRLLAALIEERVLSTFPNIPDKLKKSEFKSQAYIRAGVCMDRRNEISDAAKEFVHDETLAEIKKCQEELINVNKYNLDELNKLQQIVKNDVDQLSLKHQLDGIDNEILDLYHRIQLVKFKSQESSDLLPPTFDEKSVLIDRNLNLDELEAQADAVLKKQMVLQKELMNQHNTLLTY